MASEVLDEKAIFNIARAIDSPNARAEYLRQACGTDASLFERVQVLLRAYEEQASFLESPAAVGAAGTADQPNGETPGTVIGQYKLLQQIGDGGMGVVWMAEQTQPVQRKVAVKVIKPGMDSSQVIARFEAERQALAMMDHVNIARVFDGGATETGRPYFVMELVHGIPITKYCDDNHLTPRERLELFVPICQAIQHAHQKGIIHRDIKPSNIMITLYDSKPVPKVIDFGVAKATEQKLTERTLFTQYGAMVGTLEYMSPEQAEMSALGVDTRSDIYALGVLLYELLTGSTPLTHKRMKETAYAEILRMLKEEEPPRPSTRLNGSGAALTSISANRDMEPAKLMKLVRGELDWIVMKCLEKDRGRRYETANGLAADVQRYLKDEPVQACPPSAAYRLRKLVRRHRGPVLAASLLVLALMGGIIGTTWGLVRAANARADVVTGEALRKVADRDADAAQKEAKLSKRLADERLFASYLERSRAFRMSRRPGQRFESLEVLQRATKLARAMDLPAGTFHELRNAVIASLALPDLHLTGPWNPWPANTYSFDVDEAHALYARTDQRGDCSVRRVADDVEMHHLPGLDARAGPVLSRDGKFVAVAYAPKGEAGATGIAVHLWSLEHPSARRLLEEKNARSVDFHRNGQQVALAYNDGTIGLFKLPSGQALGRPLAPDTLQREVEIALHPTEPLVAVCSYFGRVVQVRDVRTGEVVRSLPLSRGANSVAWHPDGQTLAVGFAHPPLTLLYDRTSLQPYRTMEGAAASLRFNHGGDRLATQGWDGGLGLFDLSTCQKLFGTRGSTLRFSRDDQRLAGGVRDGKLGFFQVGDGREYRTLVRKALPEKGEYQAASLSPDGRVLAVGMTDGFGLWDLASGSELAFLRMDEERNGVTDLRFEPSGDLLTAGYSGLLRWPVRAEPSLLNPPLAGGGGPVAGRLLVGPPQRLLPRTAYIGQSKDGQIIVCCNRAVGNWQAQAGGWILHADRPNEPIRIDAGEDMLYIAVDPEGHWVVTVAFNSGKAKVWDARDGRLVKQLVEFGAIYLSFSPDGRWLSIGGDGNRLFAVGTWEPGPQVGAWGVFAPDSRLMAIQPTTGAIRLFDRAKGVELAGLEDPDFQATGRLLFTPDGDKLICLNKKICVWDLRLLRQHLKPLDLDWDYPDFRPADPVSTIRRPWQVEILASAVAKPALTPDERARRAIERCREKLNADQGSPDACNSLAWAYLTAPAALRDVKAALPLAQNALRLVPDNADYRNTLGVAYYRAERYPEAVAMLQPNLDRQKGTLLAFDLYFLAMSHHQLGETARAREYYDWAVRWTRGQRGLPPAHQEELTAFRSEADELLRIEKK
jgi:serine/threonine protein kinase/WD40 repeat protein